MGDGKKSSSCRASPLVCHAPGIEICKQAQRTKTKRERAARGLETATRQSGTAVSLAGVTNGSPRPTPSTPVSAKPTQNGGQKGNGGAGTRSSKGNGSNRDVSPERTKEDITVNSKTKQKEDGKGAKLADTANEVNERETAKDGIRHPSEDVLAADESARNVSTQPQEGDDVPGATESKKLAREEREEELSKEDSRKGRLSPMEVDNTDVHESKGGGQERAKRPGEAGREEKGNGVESTGEVQEPVAAESSTARAGSVRGDDGKGEKTGSTSNS